jgi:hypothetical protein
MAEAMIAADWISIIVAACCGAVFGGAVIAGWMLR